MKGWKIFVLAVVLYGVSVFGGFIQDDVKVIATDPQMGSVGALISSFTRPYYYMDSGNAGIYRPVTSFSFYLNALLTGKEAWGFRLVNILLYGGVCCLVFMVLRKFCKEQTAFGIALIFTVLPIHTEVVNNIVGRAEILSLGFLLLSILFQSGKNWELSALMFFLAILSKETAIVGLPILIYLMALTKEGKDVKIGVSSFFAVAAIGYLILRTAVLGAGGMGNNATIVENPLKFVGTEQRIMNAFELIPFGVDKILFPINLSYDYSFNQIKLATSWFDWRVATGVLMLISSVGSLFSYRRKNILWVVGLMLFWGPLVVTGNFLFPIGTIFGERLWFIPSLGLILMLSIFRVPKWLVILALVLFAGRTMVRNVDWLSQDRLFIRDAGYVKGSVIAQSNAAAMYLIRKDLVNGKIFMERADKIYPDYPELLNNWGMYYVWSGEKDLAKEKFERCLKVRPGDLLCGRNLELI